MCQYLWSLPAESYRAWRNLQDELLLHPFCVWKYQQSRASYAHLRMDGLTWLAGNPAVRCLLGGGNAEWPLDKPRLNATGWLGTSVASSSVSACKSPAWLWGTLVTLDLDRCLLGGGASEWPLDRPRLSATGWLGTSVASSSVSPCKSPAWLWGTLVPIDPSSLRVRFECTLGDRGCRPRRDRDRDRDRSVMTGSLAALALAAFSFERNRVTFTSRSATREGG